MYPNIKEEICEKEGNIYFEIISECKIALKNINRKLSFVSSGGKLAETQNTPTRTELEAELLSLLSEINDIKDNIVK